MAAASEELERRIIEALIQLGADPDRIARDAELEPLDIDSLDLIEVGQLVEDEYGVELDGQDVQDVRTVGDVIDLIASRVG